MAFKDGVLVFSQPGALPGAALEELVVAVRGLDVEAALREAGAGGAARRLTGSATACAGWPAPHPGHLLPESWTS